MIDITRRLYPRGPANRGVAVDAEGAALGPGCVLVQREAEGYRSLGRYEAAALQQLLFDDLGDPDWLFGQCRRIADALERGQTALAQIYGLHIPLDELGETQLEGLSFVKTGFNPAEPRVPKGEPAGGEWTSDGGSGAASTPVGAATSDAVYRPPAANSDIGGLLRDAGYTLSPGMRVVARNLYRLFMDNKGDLTPLLAYLENRGLTVDDLPDVLRSLFDGPRPLSDLQTSNPPQGFDSDSALLNYLGRPLPGYEWHHIIEQNGQFRPDLTSPEGIRTWIQNTDNMVQVPVLKHFCISGIMSSGRTIRLRDVVKIHLPEDQRLVGLGLLRFCRVIY